MESFSSSIMIFFLLQQVVSIRGLAFFQVYRVAVLVEAFCLKSRRKIDVLKLVVEQEASEHCGLETLNWTCQNTMF